MKNKTLHHSWRHADERLTKAEVEAIRKHRLEVIFNWDFMTAVKKRPCFLCFGRNGDLFTLYDEHAIKVTPKEAVAFMRALEEREDLSGGGCDPDNQIEWFKLLEGELARAAGTDNLLEKERLEWEQEKREAAAKAARAQKPMGTALAAGASLRDPNNASSRVPADFANLLQATANAIGASENHAVTITLNLDAHSWCDLMRAAAYNKATIGDVITEVIGESDHLLELSDGRETFKVEAKEKEGGQS